MEEQNIDAKVENEDSEDSSTETNEEDTTEESSAQEEKEDAKEEPVPWHEDPRWKAWQEEKENLLKFKEEAEPIVRQFKPKEEVKIPVWFGGDEEQWNAYQVDQKRIVEEAEERAIKRIKSEREDEEKRIKEANDYFEQSVTEIEKSGDKVDKNKLLKFVMDNELIDSQGRWAYKQAYKFMKAMDKGTSDADENLDARKQMAASTTSESKAEKKPKGFRTPDDFKGKSWASL